MLNRPRMLLFSLLTCAAQVCTTFAFAESPHQTAQRIPMMGVSSAWTYNEQPIQNQAIQSHITDASYSANKSKVAADLKVCLVQKKTNGRKTAETNFFDEKKFELVLDSWQMKARQFLANARPRVVAFSKWISQRLGFGKEKLVPDLKMADTAKPTIRVRLEPVSYTHQAWLMKDGRLKTVAAH